MLSTNPRITSGKELFTPLNTAKLRANKPLEDYSIMGNRGWRREDELRRGGTKHMHSTQKFLHPAHQNVGIPENVNGNDILEMTIQKVLKRSTMVLA